MNTMPQPDGPPVAPQSWWSRNWKWVVPVGCLVPMLCCFSFVGATYFGVTKVIEGSPAFTEAFARASDNPDVQATLGTPLSPGFGLSGEVKENGNGGNANFSVPLEGPKGKGTLHVEAKRINGRWNFSRIDVDAGGKSIDVLQGAADVPDGDEEPKDDEPMGE